jgi:hypothetical protein
LPLMVAGPRTPTSFAPYSDNRRQSRSPIYASDPRRPLVVGPQVLSSSTRQTSPIRRYPSAIITGREIVLSNAMLSRSSSLPLLKSGPQD